MKRLLFPLAAATALAAAVSAHAFSYQGALAGLDGKPLKGNQTVEFRLYANESGGSPLWGRACNVLLDDNGLFNTEIADAAGTALPDVSSSTPLDDVLAQNASVMLYLGVTVAGSSGEIVPRLRLLPVPYAVFAHNVSRATGDFAAGGKVSSSQLAVSGDATFAAAATVSGNATVEGDLTVSGALSGYGSVPVGTIVLWSGSANNIPDGWKLCNGQDGTPDLRGRFVVGHDPRDGDYSVNKTGGEKTHTLSVNEMPSHSHGVPISIWGYSGSRGDYWEFAAPESYYSHKTSLSSSSVGGGKAHENRPPYYALCYIMRVK